MAKTLKVEIKPIRLWAGREHDCLRVESCALGKPVGVSPQSRVPPSSSPFPPELDLVCSPSPNFSYNRFILDNTSAFESVIVTLSLHRPRWHCVAGLQEFPNLLRTVSRLGREREQQCRSAQSPESSTSTFSASTLTLDRGLRLSADPSSVFSLQGCLPCVSDGFSERAGRLGPPPTLSATYPTTVTFGHPDKDLPLKSR